MEIETVEDLCNELANLIGCYGTCKAAAKGEDCEETSPVCCRMGFMMVMPDRIREAVDNERKLESLNLKP